MNDITVIDNFIDNNYFKILQSKIMSDSFPWYFSNKVVSLDEEGTLNHFQFFHKFYENFEPKSPFIYDLYPIINNMNLCSLFKIKANLVTKTENIIEHGMHIDFNNDKLTTAVLYMNTNNGYTIFENGEKVESIENRIAIFPSYLRHSGSSCTNQKNRIIINFNYLSN